MYKPPITFLKENAENLALIQAPVFEFEYKGSLYNILCDEVHRILDNEEYVDDEMRMEEIVARATKVARTHTRFSKNSFKK